MTQCGKPVTVHWSFISLASNYNGKNVMLKLEWVQAVWLPR